MRKSDSDLVVPRSKYTYTEADQHKSWTCAKASNNTPAQIAIQTASSCSIYTSPPELTSDGMKEYNSVIVGQGCIVC